MDKDFDSYMSYVGGETSPPAGALEICVADLVLSDIEIQNSLLPEIQNCLLLNTSASGLRNSRSEKNYKDTAEEAQSIQVLAPQAESKSRPPKVQEGNDHHWYDA